MKQIDTYISYNEKLSSLNDYINEKLVINKDIKMGNDIHENTILNIGNKTIEFPIRISIKDSAGIFLGKYECTCYSSKSKNNQTDYIFYTGDDEEVIYANKNELDVLFDDEVAYLKTCYGKQVVYLLK